MATAKKVPVSEFTIHLELSAREAKVLSSVLAKVSGSPETTARRETNSIRNALKGVGIEQFAEYADIDGYLSAGRVQE